MYLGFCITIPKFDDIVLLYIFQLQNLAQGIKWYVWMDEMHINMQLPGF